MVNELIEKIMSASKYIAEQSRKGNGNFMTTNIEFDDLLKDIKEEQKQKELIESRKRKINILKRWKKK
jgi:hypothetical protein